MDDCIQIGDLIGYYSQPHEPRVQTGWARIVGFCVDPYKVIAQYPGGEQSVVMTIDYCDVRRGDHIIRRAFERRSPHERETCTGRR